MFTGIIEEVGTVETIKKGTKSLALEISCAKIIEDLKLGDSVAVNGICLTASNYSAKGFVADVMHETLNRSTFSTLKPKSSVNLERAMSANGRFGGHIVSGHIDGTGTIIKTEKDDNAVWYFIKTDSNIMRYIVEKGSIAIDGVSLTVATVSSDNFGVSLIPHTAKNTIFPQKKVGDNVNLENDIVGKYIEKLMGIKQDTKTETNITEQFLKKYGF